MKKLVLVVWWLLVSWAAIHAIREKTHVYRCFSKVEKNCFSDTIQYSQTRLLKAKKRFEKK